ncbi:hypothetical protein ACFQX7_22545 [Luedemannella flava]
MTDPAWSNAPTVDLSTHGDAGAPVFVDSSGRRRRRVRLISYGLGAVCLTFTTLVLVSLAVGPVSPDQVGPLFADGPTGPAITGAAARPSSAPPRPPVVAGPPSTRCRCPCPGRPPR